METYPNEIVLQVQAFGIRDEAIRQAVQHGMREVTKLVESKFIAAGIENPEVAVSTFMANGMLCNIAKVLEMPELKPKHQKPEQE
ncbi:hypothetical protein D3C76_1807440 [compost metagenome]